MEKKRVVIWVNHWFSTMYRLIEDAKVAFEQNTDEYEPYFIGTNKNDICTYSFVCDEFYKEPVGLEGEAYVAWCIDFCREHHVDIFVPRREMLEIVRSRDTFTGLGVKILAERSPEMIEMFENKWETYYAIQNDYVAYDYEDEIAYLIDNMKIPLFYDAYNVSDFILNYAELKKKYPNDRVCFKYSKGEGATSFRVIDDKITDISSLKTGKGMKITYDEAVKMFKSVDEFESLLMLPYMEGPEVSIDCIPYNNDYLAIPRMKTGRVTKFVTDEKFVKIALNFARFYNMTAPFNLQLRKFKGDYNLLEVNTRLSGGSHIIASAPFDKKVSLLGYALLNMLNVDYRVDSALEKYLAEGIIEGEKGVLEATQIETPLSVIVH